MTLHVLTKHLFETPCGALLKKNLEKWLLYLDVDLAPVIVVEEELLHGLGFGGAGEAVEVY